MNGPKLAIHLRCDGTDRGYRFMRLCQVAVPRRRRLRDRFGKSSFEIGCQIGWHYPSSERDLDPNRRAMPQLLQVPMFAQTLPMDAQKANQMSALP